MEARTSVVCMHLDDLRIGVKSQSNLAMAGSCRNMPQYSLVELVGGVKYGLSSQSLMVTELTSNSEPVHCIQQEWRAVRKVLFEDPNKGDWS